LWTHPVAGWALSLMIMDFAALTLLGDDVSVSRALVMIFVAAFACGFATTHWSGLLAGPVSYWIVGLISNAVTGVGGRTWEHLLPWNWLDTLTELSFYLLLPITLCSSAGWAARREIALS
jgi:hypothetical protein